MRRVLWLVVLPVGLWLTAIQVLSEGALHIPANRRHAVETKYADGVAAVTQSTWQAVTIRAQDGVGLNAWLFVPAQPTGAGAVLLHGIADRRTGSLGVARLLLKQGYTVLTPDSRGHGESGGDVLSYGVREADDLHRWLAWFAPAAHVTRLYGWGVSYGAAVWLQALPLDPEVRAIVADSPFASFSTVARDRVSLGIAHTTLGGLLVTWLMIKPALAYTDWRYKVDLSLADPAAAVAKSHTPVLLIHGAEDTETWPEHSEQLHEIDPARLPLWQVPHARHARSYGTAPEEYERRVLAWFAAH